MKATQLYISVKAGDCIRIGPSVVHVIGMTSTGRLRVRVEAPQHLLVEYDKSFVRKAKR